MQELEAFRRPPAGFREGAARARAGYYGDSTRQNVAACSLSFHRQQASERATGNTKAKKLQFLHTAPPRSS